MTLLTLIGRPRLIGFSKRWLASRKGLRHVLWLMRSVRAKHRKG